jgi:hypothetical protein
MQSAEAPDPPPKSNRRFRYVRFPRQPPKAVCGEPYARTPDRHVEPMNRRARQKETLRKLAITSGGSEVSQ